MIQLVGGNARGQVIEIPDGTPVPDSYIYQNETYHNTAQVEGGYLIFQFTPERTSGIITSDTTIDRYPAQGRRFKHDPTGR